MKFGTVVKVTGERHDTAAYPTAVLIDSCPVQGGGVRYRAIFLPSQKGGRLIEMNLYSDECSDAVRRFDIETTVRLIQRCRGQGP